MRKLRQRARTDMIIPLAVAFPLPSPGLLYSVKPLYYPFHSGQGVHESSIAKIYNGGEFYASHLSHVSASNGQTSPEQEGTTLLNSSCEISVLVTVYASSASALPPSVDVFVVPRCEIQLGAAGVISGTVAYQRANALAEVDKMQATGVVGISGSDFKSDTYQRYAGSGAGAGHHSVPLTSTTGVATWYGYLCVQGTYSAKLTVAAWPVRGYSDSFVNNWSPGRSADAFGYARMRMRYKIEL